MLLVTIAVVGGCGERERSTPAGADTGAPRTNVFDTARSPSADTTRDERAVGSTMSDAEAAATVIRDYYAAIDAGAHRDAYALWGNDGAASGQGFEAFAAGFAGTVRVEVDVGTPGRVEPAAGSRYVEIPVVIRTVERDGARERLEGTYTLRRSVVDGATEAQRRWHIYRADVGRVR